MEWCDSRTKYRVCDLLQYYVISVIMWCRDQKPAEAELHFLDAAKKLALYGVEKHPARDFEGVDIAVGVSAMGVMVYRESDGVCMNHFAWPKVLKISYHHSKFYLRIRAGEVRTLTQCSISLNKLLPCSRYD